MGWGQTQRELNLLETHLSVKINDETTALLHISLIQLAFQVGDEGKEREERIGCTVERDFTKIIYPQYKKPL